MENRKLVSVIIPTYNRGPDISNTLSSVLKQTYRPLEIIVIDDGSADETESVVLNMTRGQPEIITTYVWQENSGASAARNAGLEISSGYYVQFLDSDDTLDAAKIDIQVKQLERNPASDFAYSRGIGVSGGMIGEKADRPKELLEKIVGKTPHIMQTVAPLWRREFLGQSLRWNEGLSLGDDLEFHVRCLMRVQALEYCELPLFEMNRLHAESLGHQGRDQKKVASAMATVISISEEIASLENEGRLFKNFSRKVLSNYIGWLQVANTEQLFAFESWCKSFWSKRSHSHTILMAITIKNILGPDNFLALVNTIFKLKRLSV